MLSSVDNNLRFDQLLPKNIKTYHITHGISIINMKQFKHKSITKRDD